MSIAANYGLHAGKPFHIVFRPPIGVETEHGESTQSWLPSLRHPLVVGAVLTILSALFASLVIPATTRVWHDRPNELALKQAVVERISQRATIAIANGDSFGSSRVEKTSRDDRIEFSDQAQQTWKVDGAGVASQLNTYFRGSEAAAQWSAFEAAVSQFLRYESRIDPGPAQLDQLRDIATQLRTTSFSDPAAERLRRGFVSWPKIFPGSTVVRLLDYWKDELIILVLDSNASGFSHGFWFFH
jgi:hypothetical protein